MKSMRNITIGIVGNVLALAVLFVGQSFGQVICTQLGDFTSCDYQGRQTIQADLGSGVGTIMHPNGTTTPYVVIPTPSTPRTPHRPAPIFVAPAPPPVSAPSSLDSLYYSAPMPHGYGSGE